MYLFAFKLVATIWNNRITSPDDITDRIVYNVVYEAKDPGPSTTDSVADLFADLFRTKFTRWLRREGHPKTLVGSIISQEMYQESLKSPHTTRAELFWKAVSDLVVVPAAGVIMVEVSSSWQYVICADC
jgi:hypothetical protein